MATNMYKKYTESLVREWPVASGTQSGTVVLHPISNQIGVTITARGDSVRPNVTLPDGSILTNIANGGVGNKPGSATVAVDGSWLLTVATVVNGETGSGGAGTPSGTPVYRTTATGLYTLSATGGVRIGVIDDGAIIGGVAPVLIGAGV